MAFDLTVHHRDRKTGKISRTTPYRLICVRERRYFERAGEYFDEAGKKIEDPTQGVAKPAEPVAQAFTRSAIASKA